MFKKILTILAIVLIGLILFISLQPADFKISRSAEINVPPVVIFEEVNDLHAWEIWSPWAKLDPNCKMTYSGSEAGLGSSYVWDGNQEVGAGSNTIVESRASEFIRLKLEMLRPFAATNDVEFIFTPVGPHTRLTWTMSGKNGFFAKAAGLVMDYDQRVGAKFEKGLANLKQMYETGQRP